METTLKQQAQWVDFGCTMRGRAGGTMLIIIGLRMMLVGGHCNLITLDVFDGVSDMVPP